jgi:hypothetical protein
MAKATTAYITQALPVKARKDKAARRKARHIAKSQGRTMERVINSGTTSFISAGTTPVAGQIEKLYKQAVRDMDQRLHLKGKPRRALNDTEFNVSLPSAGDMYKEAGNSKWKGKRDWQSTKPSEGYLAARAILNQRSI